MIADSHVEMEAARLLVYRAAWVKDNGAKGGVQRVQDFVAKLYASEMAQRVTDRCLGRIDWLFSGHSDDRREAAGGRDDRIPNRRKYG